MNKKLFIRLIPFLILCSVHLYAMIWRTTRGNGITVVDVVVLILIAVNGWLYFKKIGYGLLGTISILLLSMFSIIEIYPYHSVTAYGVSLANRSVAIRTPEFQPRSLLLLVLLLILNGGFLMDWYADYKYGKKD